MSLIGKLVHIMRVGIKGSGSLYLKHLRRKGIRIGEGTKLFNPQTTHIDETSPYMITIGNNVQITGGVVILGDLYETKSSS